MAAGVGAPQAELPSPGNPHGAAPHAEVALGTLWAISAAEPPCLSAVPPAPLLLLRSPAQVEAT